MIKGRFIWTRLIWMRLATFSVLGSVLVLLSAPNDALVVRQTAQVEFMHAMGTFACATFMNIGAYRAKHTPLCFITGSILYWAPIYFEQCGGPAALPVVKLLGSILLYCGWLVLIAAAGRIDRTDKAFSQVE